MGKLRGGFKQGKQKNKNVNLEFNREKCQQN